MTRFFERTWTAKTLPTFFLLIILVICAFIFKRPLAVKSIEYFTDSHNITIQCLDFSFALPFKLKVQEACVSSPMGELSIENMTWQLWTNDLAIEEIHINHSNAATSDIKASSEQKAERLSLPQSLPRLNITSLYINSDVLVQPIKLTVKSVAETKVKITGDLSATIQVNPSYLTTDIEWRLSDLKKFIPQIQEWVRSKPELLKKAALDQAIISTLLTFDGQTLHSQNALNISSNIAIKNCPIDFVLAGTLITDINLVDFSFEIDVNQLTNQVSLENCSLVHTYLADGDSPQLSLLIPTPFTLSGNEIKIPKLSIIDLQSTNEVDIIRLLELVNLSYKTAGNLEVGYQFTLKQPIESQTTSMTNLSAEMVDFQGVGKLNVDLSNFKNPNAANTINFNITDNKQQLRIKNLQSKALALAEVTSGFTFDSNAANSLEMSGNIHISQAKLDTINIDQARSNFVVSGKHYNDLQLSLDSHLVQLQDTGFNLQNFSNHLDLNITDLDSMSVTGQSNLTSLAIQNINFQPINITHLAQVNLQSEELSSQHYVNLEQDFMLEVTQKQAKVNIGIPEQAISRLNNTLAQIIHTLEINQGKLSASLDITLPLDSQELMAKGQASIQNLSVKYQDYLVNNINYLTPVTYNSAGLQLSNANLYIDSIDVGLTISDITASVSSKNTVLGLQKVKGNIFEGEFLIPNLWLDGREQQFNVNLSNIELAEVVALQQQPGIKITGKVSGNLPMYINQQGLMVDNGWLSSLTGGKLTINNNPSFDSIKMQQPELALLENLEFTQLDSKVKFSPDGWVFFDIALKGNNPDKNQSVNFNYSHEENLYSLLESIRLVNAVGDTIEQKINQGDKK
ncbi:YdbH domain-containing protein [uncultured Paraglaciecola sp.]|uniref:YdbH domain-containing protein n=1 Tax=uncultured Paraglaciecola sp. TaxID=1765024 RepID=UPI0025930011|nr:YdbH domain-containing protein [uncultured Paraglaciecola sp.]